MEIEATNKSALLSGLIAGSILSQVESWSLSNRIEGFITAFVFICPVLFFVIGYQNIHVKIVFSWSDLTEGEKDAFTTRLPIWFVTLTTSAFLTNYVVSLIKNT